MHENADDRIEVNACGPFRRLFQTVQAHWRFKYVLPSVREVTLHGVRLNVEDLSLVMRNRLLLGNYEVHERRMAQKFLTPADSVLEIGGAIGFVGIYCQKELGISHYAVVEANPHTAGILRANYALNGLEPLLFNVALADRDGDIDLDISGEYLDNSILSTGSTASKKTRVPALCIDSILKRLCFPVNVLIIDIEGAEKLIDWRTLPAEINKILVELHPVIIGVPETYGVIAKLVSEGFSVEAKDEETYFFKKSLA